MFGANKEPTNPKHVNPLSYTTYHNISYRISYLLLRKSLWKNHFFTSFINRFPISFIIVGGGICGGWGRCGAMPASPRRWRAAGRTAGAPSCGTVCCWSAPPGRRDAAGSGCVEHISVISGLGITETYRFRKRVLSYTHYCFVGVLASLALMMKRGKRMENKQPLGGQERTKNSSIRWIQEGKPSLQKTRGDFSSKNIFVFLTILFTSGLLSCTFLLLFLLLCVWNIIEEYK